MAQKTWVLTDSTQNLHEANFSQKIGGGSLKRQTLRGGVREGVDAVEVDNGKLRFTVVPTRGMGLWKASLGDVDIGWKSPVLGPVHPSFVPVSEPSGLGWLSGFD